MRRNKNIAFWNCRQQDKIHFYTTLTEKKRKSNASAHFSAGQPAAPSMKRTMSATPTLALFQKQTNDSPLFVD
jgi:hypothetical protein